MKKKVMKILSLVTAGLSMAAFAVGCSFKKETCEHDYGATAKAVTKVATCTEGGEELWACVKCGAEKKEKTEALAHSYDEGIVKKEATCKNVGEVLYSCVHCDVTKVEVLPKIAHEVVEVAQKAPTCDVDGHTAYTYCANCNEFLTPKTAIPCGGHLVVPVKGTPATCTTEGLTDGTKCIVCNEIFLPQEVIPAKGHTVETVPGKVPTCEPGLSNGSFCTTCDEVLIQQVTIDPISAHAYDEEGICETCGKECPHEAYTAGVCTTCAVMMPETAGLSLADGGRIYEFLSDSSPAGDSNFTAAYIRIRSTVNEYLEVFASEYVRQLVVPVDGFLRAHSSDTWLSATVPNLESLTILGDPTQELAYFYENVNPSGVTWTASTKFEKIVVEEAYLDDYQELFANFITQTGAELVTLESVIAGIQGA